MRMACAECGCVVDGGVRVEVCVDRHCCCAHLENVVDTPEGGSEPDPAG